MAQGKRIAVIEDWKAVLKEDGGFREAIRGYVQEVLEGRDQTTIARSRPLEEDLAVGHVAISDHGRKSPSGARTSAMRAFSLMPRSEPSMRPASESSKK